MVHLVRTVVALALLAHLAATLALAAAPGWHQEVHADAGEHGHECAVTLFLSSGAEAPDEAPVAGGAMLTISGVAEFFREEVRTSECCGGGVRGRAPPGALR